MSGVTSQPVKRDHLPGQLPTLEVFGIKCCKNLADPIMRWRAVEEWANPAQKRQLLVAKTGDVGEGFSSRKHRQQGSKKHLVKRIDDFHGLTRVRQLIEMAEKNGRLTNRSTICCRGIHCCPPQSPSESRHRFSTFVVCHVLSSPDCPVLRTATR